MGLKFSFGNLNLLISHRSPIHPGRHWQVYRLIKSVQVPPFRQGEDPHSLKSEYIDKKDKKLVLILKLLTRKNASSYFLNTKLRVSCKISIISVVSYLYLNR